MSNWLIYAIASASWSALPNDRPVLRCPRAGHVWPTLLQDEMLLGDYPYSRGASVSEL